MLVRVLWPSRYRTFDLDQQLLLADKNDVRLVVSRRQRERVSLIGRCGYRQTIRYLVRQKHERWLKSVRSGIFSCVGDIIIGRRPFS